MVSFNGKIVIYFWCNMKFDGKVTWTIIRTLLFLIMGLFNTVFIKPEDAGTYKEYLGYFFLILVAAEIVGLIKNFVSGEKSDDANKEESE